MADSATYWATIAQVVPVLFIAVMIEFRWMLARVSRTNEAYLQARNVRFAMGIVLFAASIGLVFAFANAVNSLRQGSPADGTDGLISMYVLAAAAGLGIGGPGVVLASIATEDVRIGLWRKLPWSKLARLERRLARAHLRLHAQDREIRGISLSMRADVAARYVRASEQDLLARRFSEPARSERLAMAAKLYADADQARASLDQLLAERPEEFIESDELDAESAELSIFRKRLAELANRQA